jgi:hypothetical protein
MKPGLTSNIQERAPGKMSNGSGGLEVPIKNCLIVHRDGSETIGFILENKLIWVIVVQITTLK